MKQFNAVPFYDSNGNLQGGESDPPTITSSDPFYTKTLKVLRSRELLKKEDTFSSGAAQQQQGLLEPLSVNRWPATSQSLSSVPELGMPS